MKKRIISVFAALILCFIMAVPTVGAAASQKSSDSFQFTVNVDERWTDINEVQETDEYGNVTVGEDDASDAKTTYIVVLSMLLCVAVVVLIVSLKKAKDADPDEVIEKLENINKKD